MAGFVCKTLLAFAAAVLFLSAPAHGQQPGGVCMLDGAMPGAASGPFGSVLSGSASNFASMPECRDSFFGLSFCEVKVNCGDGEQASALLADASRFSYFSASCHYPQVSQAQSFRPRAFLYRTWSLPFLRAFPFFSQLVAACAPQEGIAVLDNPQPTPAPIACSSNADCGPGQLCTNCPACYYSTPRCLAPCGGPMRCVAIPSATPAVFPCENACRPNNRRCVGNQVQECVSLPGGCFDWSTTQVCESHCVSVCTLIACPVNQPDCNFCSAQCAWPTPTPLPSGQPGLLRTDKLSYSSGETVTVTASVPSGQSSFTTTSGCGSSAVQFYDSSGTLLKTDAPYNPCRYESGRRVCFACDPAPIQVSDGALLRSWDQTVFVNCVYSPASATTSCSSSHAPAGTYTAKANFYSQGSPNPVVVSTTFSIGAFPSPSPLPTASPTPFPTAGPFCGYSTGGSCGSGVGCVVDGCSSQVCRSAAEQPVATTCEYRACYDAGAYGLSCSCTNSKCQWGGT